MFTFTKLFRKKLAVTVDMLMQVCLCGTYFWGLVISMGLAIKRLDLEWHC
jgi:hypothetical protein